SPSLALSLSVGVKSSRTVIVPPLVIVDVTPPLTRTPVAPLTLLKLIVPLLVTAWEESAVTAAPAAGGAVAPAVSMRRRSRCRRGGAARRPGRPGRRRRDRARCVDQQAVRLTARGRRGPDRRRGRRGDPG